MRWGCETEGVGREGVYIFRHWKTSYRKYTFLEHECGNEKRNIFLAVTLTRRNDEDDGHWDDGLLNVDNEPTPLHDCREVYYCALTHSDGWWFFYKHFDFFVQS